MAWTGMQALLALAVEVSGWAAKVPSEIRRLISEMSLAKPVWGATRTQGEFLKLGIDIGRTSPAKYMAWRRRPPSQGWKTFLRNHADGIAAIDLFVVPTDSFRCSSAFLSWGMTGVGTYGRVSPLTRPLNGSLARSLRHAAGSRHRSTSSAIETAPIPRWSGTAPSTPFAIVPDLHARTCLPNPGGLHHQYCRI